MNVETASRQARAQCPDPMGPSLRKVGADALRPRTLNGPLALRELRRSDYRMVFEFRSALHKEGYLFWGSHIRHYSDTWVSRNLEASERGDAVVAVAEAKGKIAGIAVIDTINEDHGKIGVLAIVVAKGLRRRGIGTLLMNDVLEKSRKIFVKVNLYISEEQREAKRRFYRRFGFVDCDRAANHPNARASCVGEMALRITAKGAESGPS